MPYTDFDNLESGVAPGTVKGQLPNETPWEAFAYRKALTVQVFIGLGAGASQQDLTGQWKVAVHESSARDSTGQLTSAILFEQTVTWTARVTVVNLGGFALVTWQPLGDGGAGRQQTSIVDGLTRATVGNVNDPAQAAQLEAYGTNGAWQDVDSANISPSATPRQKYDAEAGFSLFTDEGAATVGGYSFFATWQSPYYRVFIPEGAVLDTVFDTWQSSVLTEALYTVSGREGGKSPALFDTRTGSQFHVISKSGQTRVLRSRHFEAPVTVENSEWSGTGEDGLVAPYSLKGTSIGRASGGVTLVLGTAQGAMRLFGSTNEGQTWNLIMNEATNITVLAAALSKDGSRYIVYGLGTDRKPAYAILKNGGSGWILSESGAAIGDGLPVSKVNGLESGEGGDLRLLATGTNGELLLFYSLDGKTYGHTPIGSSQ